MLTRRKLGLLAAGGLAGLVGPRLAQVRAAPALAPERKFLFLFCSGGWDTTYCFTPTTSDVADVEPDATVAEEGGIRFVDRESRPNVRSFFRAYGDRLCVINGVEVQSITHERCRQLILTGRADGDADDWPSILGARSINELVLPYVVMDGPAFNSRYTSQVVRVGDTAQLPRLISGEALSGAEGDIYAPADTIDAIEDAFLRQRAASVQLGAARGAPERFAGQYATALSQMERLMVMSNDIVLSTSMRGCERDIIADCSTAFDCFELGLSRCAMVRYNGWCNEGWDTHQGNELQDTNFNDIFGYLDEVMIDLSTRVSPSGGPLADELTIVVFSEMGRSPRLNGWLGKDHWTFTSTMLIGSGIRGGQVIGDMDGSLRGEPIDLGSGEVTASGTNLLPKHLGATLLALGDIDPGEHITGADPILAALE